MTHSSEEKNQVFIFRASRPHSGQFQALPPRGIDSACHREQLMGVGGGKGRLEFSRLLEHLAASPRRRQPPLAPFFCSPNKINAPLPSRRHQEHLRCPCTETKGSECLRTAKARLGLPPEPWRPLLPRSASRRCCSTSPPLLLLLLLRSPRRPQQSTPAPSPGRAPRR